MTEQNGRNLQAGDKAPEIQLPDQEGKTHSLGDYRGQWLVLYFYPKDDTPGCTKEACHFRDDFDQIRQFGASILGVSTDNAANHQDFINKFSLSFPLLCDESGACAKRFGALFSLGPFKLAKRQTFLIDPEGKIAKVYRKVKAKEHSQEILEDLSHLVNQ